VTTASSDVLDGVIDEYERLLRASGSQLMENPDVWEQAKRQALRILHGVIGDDDHVADLGFARAIQGIHPSESFEAAGLLFEAALPALAADGGPADRLGGERELALELNRALMDALVSSSRTYYDFLLDRLHRAQAEERRRVARDLHDHAAHALGVALQSLELHELYAQSDRAKSAAKLRTAKDAVDEAFDVIRRIASEMQTGLTASGLEPALESYLRTVVPPDVMAELRVDKEIRGLAGGTAEQLYLVLREAIHNVILHARATRLAVELELTGSRLRCTVADNGIGFGYDANRPADDRGVGLTSMRERVEALNGSLVISGARGGGAIVKVVVPLPGPERPARREPSAGTALGRR